MPDVLKLRAPLRRGASPDLFTPWNFYSLRTGPSRAFAVPNQHTSLELLCARGTTTGYPETFRIACRVSRGTPESWQYFSNKVKSVEILCFCKIVTLPPYWLLPVLNYELIFERVSPKILNLFMALVSVHERKINSKIWWNCFISFMFFTWKITLIS